MASIIERLQQAWNVFTERTQVPYRSALEGNVTSFRPDKVRFTRGNERTIVTSVYNRIALDAAAITFKFAQLDDNDRFEDVIPSGLNRCLTVEANIDQTTRMFIQDVVMSLLDEGSVAIVATDTSKNPKTEEPYDVYTMRTGKIVSWYPKHVAVRLYNERTGKKEDLLFEKKNVCIIENPFYSVMNENNSTVKRLLRKLTLLDAIDEQTGSGRLDLIIQLPYVIKSDARKQQAEARRKDIEMQLASSKYGVAYTDGTEKVVQLNKSIENKLLEQIEYLQKLMYSQLGITEEIMNGTADEKAMLNYYDRTIEPIVSAIIDEMNRKFVDEQFREDGASIVFFRSPFKLVPVGELAELADKFTRNEIMTSNEIRQIIGMKPSSDPNADQLRNKNISMSGEEMAAQQQEGMEGEQEAQ